MSGHWTAPTKYNIKCCLSYTLLYSCVLEATLGEWVHSLAWWSCNVASTCSSRRAFQGHLTWLGRRGARISSITSSSWLPWLEGQYRKTNVICSATLCYLWTAPIEHEAWHQSFSYIFVDSCVPEARLGGWVRSLVLWSCNVAVQAPASMPLKVTGHGLRGARTLGLIRLAIIHAFGIMCWVVFLVLMRYLHF